MRSTYLQDITNSLYNVLSHQLLEQGAYRTVSVGQVLPPGVDSSKLYPVIDPEIHPDAGYVWQSSFHNWIYESGVVNSPTPVVASGVYVNGTFKAKNDTSYGHYVDYENGRVVFSIPQSTGTLIQANFSYSEYSFIRGNLRGIKNESAYRPNSSIFASGLPASPNDVYLPAIIMELDDAEDREFQLGGTNSTHPTFRFTVIGESQAQIEQTADVFYALKKKSFPIVSMVEGPKFNNLGDLTEDYSYYLWCKKSSNMATLESVNYNRYFDAAKAGVEPEVFAGVIQTEIFALRI